jgi:deoxyribose-phosphate aldolase
MSQPDIQSQLEEARKGPPTPSPNPGLPLDLDWVSGIRINQSATERRAATLPHRRPVKRTHQAAWQLRAVSCIDLTTLAGDDTPGRVRRLCAKAKQPVRQEVLAALGAGELGLTVAAVCVYHAYVAEAVDALAGTAVQVCAVSTGFPAGLSPFPQRIAEIAASRAAGADEIDIVITRAHVLRQDWQALYDEIRAFRDACGPAHMKTILATGELGSLRAVGQASLVAMMAGADFIKTSTGKEKENATLPVGLVMARAIRAYRERTGVEVGFKPAGGIGTARQAVDWLAMLKEELGNRWLHRDRFRFGASSLLGDLERQLEHHATGRYAAAFRQPLA